MAVFNVCKNKGGGEFQIRYRFGPPIGRLHLVIGGKCKEDEREIETFRIFKAQNLGRGYGRKLLEYAEAQCKRNGISKLYVHPHPEPTDDGFVLSLEEVTERYLGLGFRKDCDNYIVGSSIPLYCCDL